MDEINRLLLSVQNALVEYHGEETWESFIDNQENGDCQFISHFVESEFPQFTRVFGEIEIDGCYCDDNGDVQNLVTHHWLELNGEKYDFAKGSLKEMIDFYDLYSPFWET